MVTLDQNALLIPISSGEHGAYELVCLSGIVDVDIELRPASIHSATAAASVSS